MPIRIAYFLSLLSGALLPFAFAPYHIFPLAILGLSGWLYLLSQHSDHAFKLGLLFGFGWFGLGGWWLADTFHIYGHIPYILGLLAVAAIGIVLGLCFAGWAWLLAKLKKTNFDLLWLFPATGLLEEWLRSFIFTGLPWTAIGNLSTETTLSGWVPLFGSYFATFIMLLLAASITLLFTPQTRKISTFVFTASICLFLLAPEVKIPDSPSHSVALIQPNIPQDQKWDSAFLKQTMFTLARLSEQAKGNDLIIWPEAAVPFYLSRATNWSAWLNEQFQSWQTPLLFGGIRLSENDKSQNVLYLAKPDGEKLSFVGKHHLVPFGEYVPSWLPFLGKLVPDIGDFEQASDNGLLTYQEQKFGSLICYESIFSDEASARVAEGANVLVVVTNDAWYDTSPAAWQHLQAAQMRALETGRYVLRAANTGVSAIIAPDGTTIQTMPWWQAGVVTGRYQPLTHQTLYQQWGNLPVLLLMWAGLGFAAYRIYRSKP